MPRAHATSPGGTDSSSFEMMSVPTLSFRTQTDYLYNHAWHTLYDLYSELVPYTEHQQHSALVTAVVAYGAANLDKPLPTRGRLPGRRPVRRYRHRSRRRAQPFHDHPRFRERASADGELHPHRRGEKRGPAGARGPDRGAADPGSRTPRPEIPPIGTVDVRDGLIAGLVVSDVQKSVAIPSLPLTANPALKHDAAGVLGVSGPNAFYLTLQKRAGLDKKSTAIGKTIAGLDLLRTVKKGDAIRSIRIVRVGQAARDFKTDDEAFKKLLEGKK